MNQHLQAEETDREAPARPCCHFCDADEDLKTYYVWAGFCVSRERTKIPLTNTVRIRTEYRDLQKFGVPVCTECATEMWRKKHLPGAIGWGLPTLGCLIGAFLVRSLRMTPSNLWSALGLCAVFGLGCAVLWAIDLWEAAFPSLRVPGMEYLVLQRVRDQLLADGDSFFTNTEYRCLFLKEPPP